MKKLLFLLPVLVLLSCQKEDEGGESPAPKPRCYSLTISSDSGYKWKTGDRICANGVTSDPLSSEYSGLSSVVFSFNGSELSAGTYMVCFPETAWVDSAVVFLPDSLCFDTPIPMVGYSSGGQTVRMSEICSRLEVQLDSQADFKSLHLSGAGQEQLAGCFAVDYKNASISPSVDSGAASKRIRSSSNVFMVPAGTYSGGFDLKMVNKSNMYSTACCNDPVIVQIGSVACLSAGAFTQGGEYHQISSAGQWNDFAAAFNSGKVVNDRTTLADILYDLDFSGIQLTSLAIRNSSEKFYCAELNGNGHSFKNATLSFPVVTAIGDGANIHDIIVDSTCSLSPDYSEGRNEFSPLIGFMQYGKAVDCRNDASINLSSVSKDCYKDLYLGGIAARMENANVRNCVNNGKIAVDKSFLSTLKSLYIGGIAGACVAASGSFKNCTNYGSISVSGSAVSIRTGGVAGYTKSYIQNCSNHADIISDSTSEQYVGGIAAFVDAKGFNMSSGNEVSDCRISLESSKILFCGGQYGYIDAPFTLNVEGSGLFSSSSITVVPAPDAISICVGGLIGMVNAKLSLNASSDAIHSGDITVDASRDGLNGSSAEIYAGGFVARANEELTLKGTYNAQFRYRGNITLLSKGICGAPFRVGGILGAAYGGARLSHCLVDSPDERLIGGEVSTSSEIGGVAGHIEGGNSILWTVSCLSDIVSAGGKAAGILAVADCDGLTDLSNCVVDALISCKSGTAAGIVASARNSAVSNSKIRVDVSASSGGGIYGDCTSSVIGADGLCTLNGSINGTAVTESNVKSLSSAQGSASPNGVTTGIGCRRVSIIGDSISTHADALPAECRPYYPTSGAGNLTVSNTYWYQLIYDKMHGATFEKNISYSGSCLSRNSDDVHPCFLSLYDRYGVGDADVVLIHGGTNDKTQEVRNYEGVSCWNLPTDAQFEEMFSTPLDGLDDTAFAPAYYKLVSLLIAENPKVRIVCIIGDALSSAQENCIIRIAGHFPDNVRFVDFFGDTHITKCSSCHPNAAGMTYMADTIYSRVGEWID